MEPVPKDYPVEEMGQWRHKTLGWSSQMEVAPSASEDDQYLFAVGVDGREVGELRSDLGHLLLEDICRTHPVYFDGTSSGTTNYRDATYTQILQAVPFSISAHAVDGTRKYGFVCRWRGTGNFGQTDQPAHTPLLALWVFDSAVIDSALSDTGRMRLILPRTPSRDIVGATDANGHANDSRLRQYNDKGFYDGGGGGYPDRGRLIACNSDIIVSHNDRFIYIFSTTNEFTPIVMWYNSDDAGATPLHFSSAQNPGWHWEIMGPNQPADPATSKFSVTYSTDAGWAYGGSPPYYYSQTFRLWDLFRNRWTKIYPDDHDSSGQIADLKSMSMTLSRYDSAAIHASDVEIAMFYRNIEVYSTLGSLRESIKGSFYSMAIMKTACHKAADTLTGALNWILDYAGFPQMFLLRSFASAAENDQGLSGSLSVLQMSDEGLAAVALPAPPEDFVSATLPTSYILGSAHLQGVHFLATSIITTQGATAKTPPSTVNSSNVVVQWSETTTEAPEMFPPRNTYTTRLDATKPFALIPCGDFMVAVGSGPAVRFRVNGTFMEIIEFQDSLELVNREAVVSVAGNALVVTKSGMFWLDPSTGATSPLGALNRVMRDLWGSTSSAVKTVYDPTMNVVHIVNTTNHTAIKLWIEKGRITQLEDFPYTFMGQQVIGGSKRAVFITDQGRFVYPARYLGESSYGTVTMAGVLGRSSTFLNKRFNFRVYSITGGGAFTFVLEDSEDTFFEEYSTAFNKTLSNEYWAGMSLYVLTGTSRGRRIPIANFDDGTSTRGIVTTDHDPSSYLAVGDYVSFSPVVFGAVGPPLSGEVPGTLLREANAGNAVLPLLITNGHAWAAKAGYTEYAPAALYPVFEMGVLDNDGLLRTQPQTSQMWFDRYYSSTAQERSCTVPDITKGYSYSSDNPAALFGYFRASGHILFPYFKSWVSNCVFHLKEWTIRGKMVPSEITV